jgi:tetratricopeptide (TPR) repeat protein
MLAEKLGDREKATEALKLVSHLSLELSQNDDARAALDKLKTLDANDPYAWEKCFDLAIEEEHRDDAVENGEALAAMYRKLGLHKKAIAVFERLAALLGAKWEIVRELARARAAAGDIDGAVKGLEKHAARLIDLESYPAACKVYEEILGIQPARAKAKEMLDAMKNGAMVQRRAKRRRIRRRVALYFVAFVLLPWLGFEALARRELASATRAIVRERLLETGQLAEARARFAGVKRLYPWTTTALLEIPGIVGELDARIAAGGK